MCFTKFESRLLSLLGLLVILTLHSCATLYLLCPFWCTRPQAIARCSELQVVFGLEPLLNVGHQMCHVYSHVACACCLEPCRKVFQLRPSCNVTGNLALGGPAPIGARKANLSQNVEPYMQEIALSEQVSTMHRLVHSTCDGECKPVYSCDWRCNIVQQ